jgi:hypothetical protein
MSATGLSGHCARALQMSAFGGKADMKIITAPSAVQEIERLARHFNLNAIGRDADNNSRK